MPPRLGLYDFQIQIALRSRDGLARQGLPVSGCTSATASGMRRIEGNYLLVEILDNLIDQPVIVLDRRAPQAKYPLFGQEDRRGLLMNGPNHDCDAHNFPDQAHAEADSNCGGRRLIRGLGPGLQSLRRSSCGSLVKLTANRLASSLVSRLVTARRWPRPPA